MDELLSYGPRDLREKCSQVEYLAYDIHRPGEAETNENLFQGYVDRGALDQALFDLRSVGVWGNSSDTDVTLDQIEPTESGGGVGCFTVTNEGPGR